MLPLPVHCILYSIEAEIEGNTEDAVKKRMIVWLAALMAAIGALLPGGAFASDTAVTLASLKLRSGPSASAKVLDTYKKGTEVTVLGLDGDWCKVKIGNRVGYMMAEYLDIPDGLEIAPVEVVAPGRSDFRPEPGESLCDTAYLLDEGQEPVITGTSYQSANVFIDITSSRVGNTDVYVADIYVRSLDSFRRGLANKWKNGTAKISKIAEKFSAILAMTSDSAENLDAGWVIMNGETLRRTKNRKRDLCVLYTNGEMAVIPAAELVHEDIAALAEAGEIWQTFLFGPSLLDGDGHAFEKFDSTVGIQNPRSVIGYYGPGHYCFVQVDGRRTASQVEKGKKNRGLTLTELSGFMETLGCKAAYNLDGGQSSVMYFNGKIHSTPQNGSRRLGDVVMIVEPEE